jgi:hypothetical protein
MAAAILSALRAATAGMPAQFAVLAEENAAHSAKVKAFYTPEERAAQSARIKAWWTARRAR